MGDFHIIIPARYGSSRLPGKPLLELLGQPLVAHVYQRAAACGARSVTVATDDERIARACQAIGAPVCMTNPEHGSGTDRLAECAAALGLRNDDVVVNLQGDEPLTPAAAIRQVAAALAQSPEASVATLCKSIETAEELFSQHVVKVVVNGQGEAMYFSRAPIPWDRDAFGREPDRLPDGTRYLRHIGLYAYRVAFLQRFAGLAAAPSEQAEKLEQLRALHHGARIVVERFGEPFPAGVDTADDLRRVEAELAGR